MLTKTVIYEIIYIPIERFTNKNFLHDGGRNEKETRAYEGRRRAAKLYLVKPDLGARQFWRQA
jgi:hypothetical protein